MRAHVGAGRIVSFVACFGALSCGSSSDESAAPIDASELVDGGSDATPEAAISDAISDATADATSDAATDAPATKYTCASPHPDWLYCDDFERGAGDFDAWYGGSQFLDSPGAKDRGRVTLASDEVHGGKWALHMPAAASSGYQGASMDWYACDGGAWKAGCRLRSYDELYFRVWVRFAPDHQYVHHFLSIGGSQPDSFWYQGTAGCLPNGALAMGTTVDHRKTTHESFFYTYFPEMKCDAKCGSYTDVSSICSHCADIGLPTCTAQPQCCWGNEFAPSPAKPFPVGKWFCFEMHMRANTPGAHDGAMEYWIDGAPAHRVEKMLWRESPTLALNRVRVQHYIETSDAKSFSNKVSFDDMVVSTSRIGCE